MDLIEAIKNRRSIRSFKPDPVPREILEQLIEVSRWSPSGSNTQPWELAILGGKELQKVKDRIARDSQSGKPHPDIPYPPMPEPFDSRQRELGKQMNAYWRHNPEAKKKPRAAGAQFLAPLTLSFSQSNARSA
jgi:nitroreductase